MLNLLRMDLRRMFRSRMFYITSFILVAGIVLTVTLMHVVTDPDARAAGEAAGMVFTSEDEDDINEILSLSKTDALCSTIYSGGIFNLAIYIVTALFVCSDFASGFAKNIFSVQGSRGRYFLSKLMCMAIVGLVWMAGTWLVFEICCQAVGLRFAEGPAINVGVFVGGFGLTGLAFCAQSILLCVLLRSEGAGIAAGIIIPSGLAVSLLEQLLGMWGISIFDWTLYGCTESVVARLVLGEPFMRHMAVAMVWLVLFVAVGMLTLKKKDI